MDVIDAHEPRIFGVGDGEPPVGPLVAGMRAGHVVGDGAQMARFGQIQGTFFFGNQVAPDQQASIFHAVDVLRHLAFAAARCALVHEDELVLVGRDHGHRGTVIGGPPLAFADVEEHGIHALLRARPGVEVVSEHFLVRAGAVMHHHLPAAEMGVAEGRRDEEYTAGDREVGRHLAAGNHALHVGQRGGEKRGLPGHDQQRTISQFIATRIEGHGYQFLSLEPVERLLAGLVERLAEAIGIGGFVGRQPVADEHGVWIAAPHRGFREVDGQPVARFGDDGLGDPAQPRRLEHRLILSMVVAIAQGPVGFSGGAAKRPVHQLQARFGSLDQRRGAQDFAHMRGQVQFRPAGLEVDEDTFTGGGRHILTFREGGLGCKRTSAPKGVTILIASTATTGSARRHG
jgi:hypothetical protein